MKFFFLVLYIYSFSIWAQVTAPNYPSEGIVSEEKGGFLDQNVDYSRFSGRVSDKDESGSILKIKVENNNTKFFRSGDRLSFKIGEAGRKYCHASVKSSDDFYFIMHVNDIKLCNDRDEYFKRGTVLNFYSETLATRIYEGSKFREMLLLKKSDFLSQLSKINHFLWSYDQKRMQLAAEYDQKILDVQKDKQRALDDLVTRKQDGYVLQTDLQRKLDELDDNLDHYRVERQELMSDRWHLDHDQGHPVGRRPLKLKLE